MADAYLILAPILLLGVVALLRFIGCTSFGAAAEPAPPAPPAPVPTITSISPESVTAGGPIFTLTVNGTGFVSEDVLSVVQWNGVGKNTTFFSATKLTATIPASDIATAGNASVTVFTPPPGGGTSNAKDVTINPVSVPVPALVTVTFSPDPSGTPGALPVPYKNLNFDANWNWERGIAQDLLNHIFLVSGRFSGSFSFVGPSGPRLLKRIKVSWASATPGTGTVNISDDNSPQQTASLTIMNGQTLRTVETMWTKTATTITVSFPVVDTLAIDEIDYQGPP